MKLLRWLGALLLTALLLACGGGGGSGSGDKPRLPSSRLGRPMTAATYSGHWN